MPRSNHAKYAPSSADRWSLCPGSVKLTARIPEGRPASWTIEGRRAHLLLQLCLTERETDAWFYEGLTLRDAESEFKVDAEHCASVQVALDYVYPLLEIYPHGQLYVERYLPIPQTVVPPDDVGGTADVMLYMPELRRLHVVDFKHGEGVVVEIDDNKQVRMYALAALEDFPEPVDDIMLTIIQPRAFHPVSTVRSEVVTPRQLVEFQADMEGWITECERADAPLVAGDVQCRWCPAKAQCPAYEKRALAVFGKVSVPELKAHDLPLPQEMTPERIVTVLDAWDHIQDWYDAVRSHAMERLAEGGTVPGWKLAYALERRRWDGDPQDIARRFMEMTDCDLDDIYPRTLVGITQAEKLAKAAAQLKVDPHFKKQAVAKALEALSHMMVKESSGKVTLVKESDPRPAITPGESFRNVAIPKIEMEK